MCASRFALRGALVVSLLGLGCNSSSRQEPPPSGQPSLAASCAPASVTAGQGTATCTAVLQNSSEAITWTLSGPGTLSATTGTSVVYQPPAQVGAAAVAHVAAAAAGLTAPVDVQIAPGATTGLTVTGRAVDAQGYPLAGVGVAIRGLHATTTGPDGEFTFSGVTSPYDLALFTEGPGRTVTAFMGLTRADPTLALHQAGLSGAGVAARGGSITGALTSGGAAPAGSGDYLGVLVASRQLPASDPPFAWSGALGTASTYVAPVSWSGATTLGVSVLAVEWQVDSATAAPTAYWVGSAEVTLTDLAGVEAPAISLAPAAAVSTRGQVDLAPGYVLQRLSAQYAASSAGPAFPLFYDEQASWRDLPTFIYVLPDPGTGSVHLCARAASTDATRPGDVAMGCRDVSRLAEVELSVVSAPDPSSPANGANAVGMDTPFTWQQFPGGVHVLEVAPEGVDAPTFRVFTAGTRAVLPSLGPAELSLPSGAAYTWRVRGLAPIASVDELAAPGAVPLPLDYPAPLAARWWWGRSTAFRFTAR